jgi:hypothetical protein
MRIKSVWFVKQPFSPILSVTKDGASLPQKKATFFWQNKRYLSAKID